MKKNEYEELKSLILNLQSKQKEEINLKEFGFDVLEITKHKRNPRLQKEYISKFKNYILPHFENKEFSQIKSIHLEKWQNQLLESLSTSSVSRIKYIFYLIFKKAIANDLINKNPFDFVDSFQTVTKKKKPFTITQINLLLNHSDSKLNLWLNIAFSTGMRIGEILALQWSDIDYVNKIININKSIANGKIIDSNKIKNHNRKVIITNNLLNILKENHNNNNIWIFETKKKEHYFNSKVILNKCFKPLVEKLNIKNSLQATRHTYISLLRNNGIDLALIQQMVGHNKGSSVTDNNYATYEIDSNKKDAINNVFIEIIKPQEVGL